MWLVITDPHGAEEMRRELAGNELMDSRAAAEEYAAAMGMEIDDSDGYIPNCSGDIRVEFREDPDNAVHIWTGESFYFKEE